MTDDEVVAEQLPEDAKVIRCGEMRVEDLERSAQRYFDTQGEREYALSFFSSPTGSADEVARLARCPNRVIRVSTAGRIHAAGHQLVRTGSRQGHYSIFWSHMPSTEEWEAFSNLFDSPVPNVAVFERRQ